MDSVIGILHVRSLKRWLLLARSFLYKLDNDKALYRYISLFYKFYK